MPKTLESENSSNTALNYAFKLLSIRPRTIFQISEKLKEKNFSDAIINDIIKTLVRRDYLNDKKYAAEWIEEKNRTRPIGRMLAEKKLKDKGIEREIIKKILDQKISQPKESALAKSLAAKKIKQMKNRFSIDNRYKILQKLSFFLASRGFNYGTITEVLEKYKA